MKIIYHQAAAIPFRLVEKRYEILLVTSRNNRQWTIPKGLIDPGNTAEQTAVQEAFEEAGIMGTVCPDPVLEFSYRKWQGTCEVRTYFLRVEQELENWPEKFIRQRRWVTLSEAARLIRFPEVREFLGQISSLDLMVTREKSRPSKK
jgi:8-oxo-dGTP pyrophosphatase MutT (NUDIX family)